MCLVCSYVEALSGKLFLDVLNGKHAEAWKKSVSRANRFFGKILTLCTDKGKWSKGMMEYNVLG